MSAGDLGRRVQLFRDEREGWIRVACYVVSIGTVLAVWQAIGHDFGILFAPFTATLDEIRTLVSDGSMAPAMKITGKLYLITLAVDIAVGTPAGLALARSRWFADAFEPYIFILYAAPTVALVPIAFAIFGFGLLPQVVIAVLISVFPIVFGVAEGARSIPGTFLDVAANYGSSEAQLWRDVILPYVTPYLMTGIRQTIPMALVGSLVAEFFLAADGVSGMLIEGVTEFQPAKVLAVTVIVSLLALVLVAAGEVVERVLLPWQRTSER